MSTQEAKIKKISLEQFIVDHHHMFTVVGVFGGLTALFAKLENASFLAFFSFIMFIFLDIDIWIRFPKSEQASWSLRIFELLLQFYVILIGWYMIQTYPNYVSILLPFFFMFIFMGIFLLAFDRFKLFDQIRKISPPFHKRSTLTIRMIIAMAIVLGLFYLSLVLGNLVSTLIRDYFHYPPIA